MKLKSLLFMVTLLLTCLGVRADEKVVFEQHFESEQTAAPTDLGFYEYINSMTGDTRTVEDGALKMFNDPATLCKTERWQRAVKFRNLPLVEGKTYRLDFKMKGSKTYNDGETDVNCKLSTLLMQGEDNADISLLGFDGAEQRLEAEDFNPDEFVDYSKSFVFVSEQQQKEAYTKGELADKYFLTLSVFNPGTFYIKDVVLTETDIDAIETAEFGYSAIKIKFRGANNIADLAKADPRGVFVFDDISFATVTVDGNPAKIESIEYREDGCLYIFTDPYESPMAGENVISVTFTNPTDEKQIMFNGKIAASFYSFENLAPTYEGALDNVFSNLWLVPTLVSSSPAKNSFAIDPKLGEFSFTFDRKVETTGITAVLNRGGAESGLILKDGQDNYAETVVFVRNDNGVLAKSNTITLTNVVSEKGMASDDPFVVSFEAGKPKVAEEIYTPTQTIDFTNDAVNTIPLGWTLVNDSVSVEDPGEVRASGSSHGSGPRLLKPESFYVRTNKTNGITTTTYGNLPDYAVTLPVGDLRIQFLASGYKKAGQKVLCEVLDATGQNVLASEEHFMEAVTPDGQAVNKDNLDKITVAYINATEQNAILRYTVFNGGGETETMLAGVIVNTYEKTEGDIPDDKEIMSENFAKWDNITPTAGSGWNMYDNGELLSKGEGGMRSRVMGTKGVGLAKAYFCRSYGDNYYATYGEEAEGPKLTLEKGTEYEITYYAAIWNAPSAKEGFAILDSDGNVLFERLDDLKANAENGGAESFNPDKFVYTFTPEKSGDYILKFWGTSLTVCGNISVIQPGSRAVKYYSLLAQAVKNAKAALEKCDSMYYDGTTKTALTEAIAKYEDPDKITMTTEEEFKAAIEELEGLTKSMLTRFEYIPRFKKAFEEAEQAYTSAITTKYEKLECFEVLGETIETYGSVDPSDLEDEELVAATTEMENNTTLLNNMKNTCVGFLTKQIASLANMLVKLDETMADDKYVIAAKNAVTDDQEIAYQLKLRIVKAIYDQCVQGDPFNQPIINPETGEPFIDPETGLPMMQPVEIDVTNFIQNAGFYSTGAWPATVTDFPGWTIEKIQGNIGPSYGTASWGGERASALKPVVEASIRTDWGTHEFDAKQLIDILPVAKSFVSIIVGEDGVEPHEAYAYIGEGEAKDVKYYDGETPGEDTNSYSRDTNKAREFTDVTPTIDEEKIFGSILLGAHARVNAAFARVDNAVLKLTAKVDGFDYAAAAAEVAKLINAGEFKKGDVNGDGVVDGTDIQVVINIILAETNDPVGDVNGDGEVDGTDIQEIINIILQD